MRRWLLPIEEFGNSYASSGGGESNERVLYCYGDPGVGHAYIGLQGGASKNGGYVLTSCDIRSLVTDSLIRPKGEMSPLHVFSLTSPQKG